MSGAIQSTGGHKICMQHKPEAVYTITITTSSSSSMMLYLCLQVEMMLHTGRSNVAQGTNGAGIAVKHSCLLA